MFLSLSHKVEKEFDGQVVVDAYMEEAKKEIVVNEN